MRNLDAVKQESSRGEALLQNICGFYLCDMEITGDKVLCHSGEGAVEYASVSDALLAWLPAMEESNRNNIDPSAKNPEYSIWSLEDIQYIGGHRLYLFLEYYDDFLGKQVLCDYDSAIRLWESCTGKSYPEYLQNDELLEDTEAEGTCILPISVSAPDEIDRLCWEYAAYHKKDEQPLVLAGSPEPGGVYVFTHVDKEKVIAIYSAEDRDILLRLFKAYTGKDYAHNENTDIHITHTPQHIPLPVLTEAGLEHLIRYKLNSSSHESPHPGHSYESFMKIMEERITKELVQECIVIMEYCADMFADDYKRLKDHMRSNCIGWMLTLKDGRKGRCCAPGEEKGAYVMARLGDCALIPFRAEEIDEHQTFQATDKDRELVNGINDLIESMMEILETEEVHYRFHPGYLLDIKSVIEYGNTLGHTSALFRKRSDALLEQVEAVIRMFVLDMECRSCGTYPTYLSKEPGCVYTCYHCGLSYEGV